MDEYIKRTKINPSQYKKNKKRTICGILSGCSTSIKTINEWNITWNDLLDISSDTSSVKLHIINYLNPQNVLQKNLEDITLVEQFKPNIVSPIVEVKNITVYFNRNINLYNIKEALYGSEKAFDYMANICHNLSKYNKLDWINDPDIMGNENPITHIGKHQYEVYTSVGIMKKMTLEEIDTIGNFIIIDSFFRCMFIAMNCATNSFDPNLDDSFHNLYSVNLMRKNPYDKIHHIKDPKYKISNKCKIGLQKQTKINKPV
jgi:hypothetical protein